MADIVMPLSGAGAGAGAGTLDRETRNALKALSAPSDVAGLRQLAGHAGLIALAAAAVYASQRAWGPWAALPFQAVLGVFLVFLFAPLHETIHRTAFASRRLNDALALGAGAILILPPQYFRAFHLAHHRYTQIPGQDPELAGRPISGFAGYALYLSGLPYWRAAVAGLTGRALGQTAEPFLTDRIAPAVVTEARLYLAFYGTVAAISVAMGSAAVLTYWLVPVLLGQPFLRFYLLAEHNLCPQVADMFRNTRTTLTLGIVRFLAWNMPYHCEHHAFMAVPFHRLPDAHRLLRNRIETISPGYLPFHRHFIRGLSASPVSD